MNKPAAKYSPIRKVGNAYYISGQVAFKPDTLELISDDIKEQIVQVMKNIKNLLENKGLSMGDLVKTTVLLDDIDNYAVMNEVYAEFIVGDTPPARAAYAVKALPFGAKIEIEAIAYKES
jgi:2-iminobutanoate/2-iminopropanoate deaminase